MNPGATYYLSKQMHKKLEETYHKCITGNVDADIGIDLPKELTISGEMSVIDCESVYKLRSNIGSCEINTGFKGANADAELSISPTSLDVETGIYAGRAHIGGEAKFGCFRASSTVEGNIGVGGNVNGGVSFNNYELCVEGGAGASAGIGGKVDIAGCVDLKFFKWW